MDTAGNIGRLLATPQYWLGMFVAVFLIGVGIYAIIKPRPGHSILYGGGFVASGVLIGVLARRWYYLVMNNNSYARVAGVMDVLNILK